MKIFGGGGGSLALGGVLQKARRRGVVIVRGRSHGARNRGVFSVVVAG